MSQPLLGAEGLGRFLDSRWIWRGLELGLDAGEQLAVVGATGSGKSLLLRCLASLDSPDEGTLRYAGRAYGAWDIPQLRSRVVYLHQRPALVEGSVDDILAAPFRLSAHSRRRYDRSRAIRWLAQLERPESFLRKSTTDLSGGEQQIAALLRALCIEPSVLLLDEATAAMDAATTEGVESLIRHWVADDKARAVVWTSHDAVQVERIATRTLELAGTPA